MKILCVIDSLCIGGAQRQLVELSFAFQERGHRVSFLTYHHIPFFNEEVEQKGIRITCIHEPRYLMRMLKMRRFIRKGNYDAVLSFLEAASFISEVAGLPFRRWKLVVGERAANPAITRSLKLRLYRWGHLLADAVVSNSRANLKLVYQANPLIPKKRSHVIYNIIDFDRFTPPENFEFRRNRKVSLVVAARVKWEKNVTGLIDALSLLNKEERRALRIDWYGEDQQRAEANPLYIEALEEVRKRGLENMLVFHGATNEIRQVVRQADAVGLFSFYEGFPNALCEAMACGKPVICSRVSDIPWLIPEEWNIFFDPADAYSIRDALRELIRMNPLTMKKAGLANRQAAMEQFRREKIVDEYLELLTHRQRQQVESTETGKRRWLVRSFKFTNLFTILLLFLL